MHAIDVLIPYYGDVALLKEAVTSVMTQTNPDWRLTVIDDHYPDEEPARWFGELSDPRIKYLRNETNLGANANFRRALSLAEAPVVVMMGADDVMLPAYVEVVLTIFAEFPGVAVVQPGVRIIDDSGNQNRSLADTVKSLATPQSSSPVVLQGQDMAASLLNAAWHYFPSLAWRRPEMTRIGFRHGLNVVQDLALLIDIAAEGGSVAVTSEVVFHYRRHQSSDSSVRSIDGSRFEEERTFFRGEAQRLSERKWRRAAFAARIHWASRLNAASVLCSSLIRTQSFPRRPQRRTARALLRHIVT